jgi:hypothetical protein
MAKFWSFNLLATLDCNMMILMNTKLALIILLGYEATTHYIRIVTFSMQSKEDL